MFNQDEGYMKIICDLAYDKRVVGFHILAPNAGEITQGMAVAMKMEVTKDQLDSTVGIHPTVAEEFTTLTAVKGDDDGKKEGC